MSRSLATAGLGVVGSRMILRLLATGRGMRAMAGEEDVRPGAGASFVSIDGDHGTERQDAVAGSEFVDDRIRLQE